MVDRACPLLLLLLVDLMNTTSPKGDGRRRRSTSPRCRPATGLGVGLYYAPARQRDRQKGT